MNNNAIAQQCTLFVYYPATKILLTSTIYLLFSACIFIALGNYLFFRLSSNRSNIYGEMFYDNGPTNILDLFTEQISKNWSVNTRNQNNGPVWTIEKDIKEMKRNDFILEERKKKVYVLVNLTHFSIQMSKYEEKPIFYVLNVWHSDRPT